MSVNHSPCPWPGTARHRFREREDDRHWTWWGEACTGCGTEVWAESDGTRHHAAFGPTAETFTEDPFANRKEPA
jgi:hypothetical protein